MAPRRIGVMRMGAGRRRVRARRPLRRAPVRARRVRRYGTGYWSSHIKPAAKHLIRKAITHFAPQIRNLSGEYAKKYSQRLDEYGLGSHARDLAAQGTNYLIKRFGGRVMRRRVVTRGVVRRRRRVGRGIYL